jgi:hypothetical protein
MAHDQEIVGSNPSTVYWMDVSNLLAITLKKNWKIKIAKWGTPKKKKFRCPQLKIQRYLKYWAKSKGVGLGGGCQGFQEKIVRGPTILGLLHFC